MQARQVSRFAIAMMVPAILSGGGCKKKPPAPPPPPPPQEVEARLQVTSISPSAVNPNQSVGATINGGGFEDGATVAFIKNGGVTPFPGTEVRVSTSNSLSVTIPALELGTYDVKVINPGNESTTLRSGLTVKVLDVPCKNVTVNFDFDRSNIRSDARSTLDSNMSCFQSLSGQISIEGHADERGTVDYNLALGLRRANSVKDHLTRGGVSGSRVSTTTRGEEQPIDRGHNEAAWAKNRRAEIRATE